MRLSAITLASVVGGGISTSISHQSTATAAATEPTDSEEAKERTDSDRSEKRYRTFRRLPITNPRTSAVGRAGRNHRHADDVPSNDGNPAMTKSFEVCQLSPSPHDVDLDIGILEEARIVARGGCSSEDDICILPNVIGFDVQSSFAVDDQHEEDDDFYFTTTGICYPQELMHQSYIRNRIPDWGNEDEDRSLRSFESKWLKRSAPVKNLLRETITKQESYLLSCASICRFYERPNIVEILAEMGSQDRRRSLLLDEATNSSQSISEDSSLHGMELYSDGLIDDYYAGHDEESGLHGMELYSDDLIDDYYAGYDEESGLATTSAPFKALTALCGFSFYMIVTRGFSTYPSLCPFDVRIPFRCWNTTGVTDMEQAFVYLKTFDEPIGCWDTSAVTNMKEAFRYASSFNQPLEMWDTSSVQDMNHMFYIAGAFNQNLDSWNTSSVTDTSRMFGASNQFNQPIGSWDVSNVETMNNMFMAAMNFNQPLDDWDTSKVTDLTCTFCIATSFNHSVDSWDISSADALNYTFKNAMSFNQPLNSWDVSGVKSLYHTFYGAMQFNQPLDSWDVSNVKSMEETFRQAKAFNQPLDGNNLLGDFWDVSSVTSMVRMFDRATSFNQCLGTWFASLGLNEYADVNSTKRMFYHSGCPAHWTKEIPTLESDDCWDKLDSNTTDDFQSQVINIVYDEGTPQFNRGPWCQDERHECYIPQQMLLSTMWAELTKRSKYDKKDKGSKGAKGYKSHKSNKNDKSYKGGKSYKSYKSYKEEKDEKYDKKKWKRN